MRVKSVLVLALFAVALSARSQHPEVRVEHGHCPQYPDTTISQAQIGYLNWPTANAFRGYMEHLPKDYNANPTKKYPLMIFIPGGVQLGLGIPDVDQRMHYGTAPDTTGLCQLFGPSLWTGFPTNMVEGWPTTFPDPIVNPITKENFSFILISVQMQWFDFNNSQGLNVFIDSMIARYRVDVGRIYLTAISKGAGYALNWLEASPANASRIAAAVLSSPCGYVEHPENLAAAHLPIWTTQCTADSVCYPIKGSPLTFAEVLANGVNSQTPAPNPPAYVTVFPTTDAVTGNPQDCKPLTHDTWGWIFDKAFRKPVNGGPNVNAYEWMVQYSRAAVVPLPVTFTSFTARLDNKKVYLDWTIAQEKNNRGFTIERAGPDQKFTILTTIPSKGDISTNRSYQTVDNSPLSDISYYRIYQTDENGTKKYYETRKVINTSSITSELIVSPNPFNQQISAYITLKKGQHVSFTITDITGKKVQSVQGLYNEGSTEVNINASNLRPGVYLLRVQGETFSNVTKIMKN